MQHDTTCDIMEYCDWKASQLGNNMAMDSLLNVVAQLILLPITTFHFVTISCDVAST